MAKKPANRNGTPSRQGVDLQRLRQCDAAWLIDKPASWLRHNANLVKRNSDGSYDAQKLVQAFAAHGFQGAELSEEDREDLEGVAHQFSSAMYFYWILTLNMLRNVQRDYGAAGMATIAQCFLDSLEKLCKENNYR